MVDNTQQAIVTASNYSVRQFSPTSWGGFVGGDALGFLWPSRADLLPRWGSLECDIALRVLYYTQHNSLVGGATEAWIEKFLSIPYEISGGRNLTYTWQDLFFESEYGEGYDVLCSKGLVDYLTLNRGWFMEIISYGDPDTPIKEGAKILGLGHLDALRIIFTGNLEHPYLYQSEWDGGLHKMHRDRVIHISRQPSPDTRMFNIGKSALYDSVTISNAQILLGRHQNEMLNDLPPPGIVIFNNVKADEVETAMRQFEYERIRDGQNVYRAPLSLSSKDPSQPATVTFVPMATVPEGFNYREYMDTHVNLLALTYGLDPQDIWPLSGAALGTGAQSKVLAAKTGVKGPGYLSTRLTRKWNKVLPRQLEWQYKAQNAEQDRETADIAKLWTDIANAASFASQQEKRQLVVNQVGAFADVLADEQGIARVSDEDIETPQQEQIVADDTTELDTPTDTQDTTANDQTQAETTMPQGEKKLPAAKAPLVAKPKQAPIPKLPFANGDNAVNNKFKEVKEQLDAGLITMSQAQQKLGVTVDPLYEGMYIIDGFPTPREKVRELWQVHFGRGVASFETVVSGQALSATTGETVSTNGDAVTPSETPPVTKAIDDTESAFIAEIQASMQDGIDGVVTKASTAARIRGAITRYGKLAYIDGLEDGGVDASEFDDSDKLKVSDIAVHDTQYVSDLVNEIYSEAGMTGNPETRAPLWRKTLDEFYYAGIESADANGMYQFVGDDGEESCADCQRLKDVKHRMKWWVANELRPGVDTDNFACGGYRCQHYLEKVTK